MLLILVHNTWTPSGGIRLGGEYRTTDTGGTIDSATVNLSGQSKITVSIRHYRDPAAVNDNRLINQSNDQWSLSPKAGGGGVPIWIMIGTGGRTLWGYASLPSASVFHHYFAVLDRTVPSVVKYLDNVLDSTASGENHMTASGNFPNAAIVIGPSAGRSTQIGIWAATETLTTDERTALYNGANPRDVHPTGLLYELYTESLAFDIRLISYSQSGGLVLNGSITDTRIFAKTPSGGLVLNGTITDTRIISYSRSGGLVLNGSIVDTRTISYTESGGLVLNGSITDTRTVSYALSGGLVLNGSIADTLVRANAPSGGLVLNGSVVDSKTYTDSLSNGIVLNGSVVDTLTHTYAESAGIVLNGSVVDTRIIAYARTGGVVLNGSITDTVVKTSTLSGGVILNGSITDTRLISYTRSGGLVLNGSVTDAIIASVARSGGLVLNGSVVDTRILATVCAGGIVLDGVVDTEYIPPTGIDYYDSPVGGVVLEGACDSDIGYVYNAVPIDGIVLDGSNTSELTVYLTTLGGISLSGTTVTTRIIQGAVKLVVTPAVNLKLTFNSQSLLDTRTKIATLTAVDTTTDTTTTLKSSVETALDHEWIPA